MKLQYKAALIIFVFGLVVLGTILIIFKYYSYQVAESESRKNLEELAETVAGNLQTHLSEKVSVTRTLAHSPIIITTLLKNNENFAAMTEDERKAKIATLNKRWMDSRELTDPFLQEYLKNPVSDYLHRQQAIFPGEYGEVFITNIYGAIISTTNKLTTLAHSHKYWWIAARHDGTGKVFIDDRGYDTSVKGYVLGIVVPIKWKNKLIGLLKANFNIVGTLYHLVHDFNKNFNAKMKIVRSRGLVVLEEGKEALSTSIPIEKNGRIAKKIYSTIMQKDGRRRLVGFAPIGLTAGSEKVSFGGKYASVDHIKGNTGEGWHTMMIMDMEQLGKKINNTSRMLIISGLLLTFLIAIVAMLLGNKISRPIVDLEQATKTIGSGILDTKIEVLSNDEIGELAKSFNTMIENLKKTMASRDELAEEVAQRKQAEKEKEEVIDELKAALADVKTLTGFIPICASCKQIKDNKGYWKQIEAYISEHSDALFSHGLCPDCAKKLYPDLDLQTDKATLEV
ncbi:HAMP domain-containing protein [Candidatus Riflebacteria bacterium]